jgi:hypothetical protein
MFNSFSLDLSENFAGELNIWESVFGVGFGLLIYFT